MPSHGQEIPPNESSGLSGWHERVNNGEDFILDVTGRLKKVLDYLIAEKIADPSASQRWAPPAGDLLLSILRRRMRGSSAPLALHPSQTSRYFLEFRGAEQKPLVQRLALERHVDALAGRLLWLVIGDRDARVSTDSAIRFARRVTAVSFEKKLPALVEFHVISEPKGHTVPAGWPERAADWFRKQLPEKR